MQEILGVLDSLVRGVPGLELLAVPRFEGDRRLQLRWEHHMIDLELVWARNGWPSEVREAIRDVDLPWPRRAVVSAHHLSPGALRLLQEVNANWIDAIGHIRLVLPPHVLILREPGQAKVVSRPRPFAWSRARLELIEILLLNHREDVTIGALQERTAWSAPQVSIALRGLVQMGWVERRGPPRGPGVSWRVSNPGALLEAWSEHAANLRTASWKGHRLLRDPVAFASDEVRRALAEHPQWAVSGWVGAHLLAPFMTFVPSLQLYVDQHFFFPCINLLRDLNVREVDEGANVEMWALRRVWTHKDDTAIPVVNAARLYADLRHLGGRAEETGEHLREVVLGF